ncbi:hypothetical protein HYFRA_00002230 [Hymenoscyphus fraxineus]|uniref:Lysine-specific metallo-endopeptidase domain-containing protein n=1 Tax=Hymenoscyphus fraxineus TaxID=746836 RepID=A0A9N9PJV7_9HELO|nr:hypothetical protein HYFRA_00002230 [Hymenoscyphus fraxineus]
MIPFLPLIVLGLLVQAVHSWGYHESCNTIGQQLKDAMQIAFRRAAEAKQEIDREPRDKHIEALLQILFGGDEKKVLDFKDACGHLSEQLQGFDLHQSDLSDGLFQKAHLTFVVDDLLLHRPHRGYTDPDRGGIDKPVMGTKRMDNCRSEDRASFEASTRALTINRGAALFKDGERVPELYPDTIQLCPWSLKKIAGPPPKYDTPDELVKQAADKKSKGILGRFIAKRNGETATPIDSLFGLEQVLLHELTHTYAAGYSDDTPANACYGWKHSAKCQLSHNVDNIAYFALAVELVLHRGYTVNKDGTLQPRMK